MLASLALALLQVAIAPAPLAPAQLQPSTFIASLGAKFGSSIDIDGDWAVIGAPDTGEGTSLSGAAYVYARNGTGWDFTQRLDSPTVSEFDNFGAQVKIQGDTLIVSCRYMTTSIGGFNAGGALVFERTGATWTQTGQLSPPAGYAGAHFGLGLDFEGDLAVLSPRTSSFPYLVYERQAGGTWSLVQEIFLANSTSSTHLIHSAPRIEGDTLFLPHPGFVISPGYSGEIQEWSRGSAGWTFTQAIRTSMPDLLSFLGTAFDVLGDTLVASSPSARLDPQLPNVQGVVYVFERVAGAWQQTDQFSDTVGTSNLGYGQAVALSEELLLVGQSGWSEFIGPTGTASHVLIYERTAQGFELLRSVTDPGGIPVHNPSGDNYGALFGGVLALDGDRSIIGARYSDDLFERSGQAYGLDVGKLAVDTVELSLSAGGTQQFELQAGLPNAGGLHFLLGSALGSSPGFPFGGIWVPLIWDGYLISILSNPAGSPLQGALGTLDSLGRASAQFVLPPNTNPALAGLLLHHAFVVLDPNAPFMNASVSEAEPLLLLP